MGERAGGPRRLIAGILLYSSALLLAPGGASAAPAPPAPRLAVEEVRRQATRVTWNDANGGTATPHRVQRRVRRADGEWSAWVDLAPGSDPSYVIDAGPDGSGLMPADYAYRGQRRSSTTDEWSDWSAPVEFTIAPQCSGGENPPGNEAPGSLPTVAIGDLNADRRYTGTDIWLALQKCSKLGGCVLEALPTTYDDVSISLYGQNDTRPCTIWSPLICEPMPPFPRGLVIQGHGSATVFRSPLWKSPYKPAPIFQIWHAPGVQLRFRNFTLDGRKSEQVDPKPGVNDSNSEWAHDGIYVTHHFGPDQTKRYPNGCIHNVTARNLFHAGIRLSHVANWRVEYNRVADIGCWKGLTECPMLTIPDLYPPPPAWGCDGYRVPGYGIYVEEHSDGTEVAYNRIERVSKYALAAKDPTWEAASLRLRIHRNEVRNVGVSGLLIAGATDSAMDHNLVDGTHSYGCRAGWAWDSWGIKTDGHLVNVQIRDNVLRNLASVGIGSNAKADGLVFADNQIDDVCVERNAKIDSRQAAIQIGGGTTGNFLLSNNRVTRNHCSMALAVGQDSDAQVIVDGGYYSTAENSDDQFGAVNVTSDKRDQAPRVLLGGGVVFEYLGSAWKLRRRPGIVASGNGRVVVRDDSVRVNGYRSTFDEAGSCLDGCGQQKKGVIVRCASTPDPIECQSPPLRTHPR